MRTICRTLALHPQIWGHRIEPLDVYKRQTYTEEGYTGDICCKSCHAVITQGQVIPKLTPPVTPVIPSEPAKLPYNPNAGSGADKLPFTDVSSNSWYYSSVRSAWEKGLIDGVTANEFKPNATLTVAQTIKLAAALHQLDRTGEVDVYKRQEKYVYVL